MMNNGGLLSAGCQRKYEKKRGETSQRSVLRDMAGVVAANKKGQRAQSIHFPGLCINLMHNNNPRTGKKQTTTIFHDNKYTYRSTAKSTARYCLRAQVQTLKEQPKTIGEHG
jgi:hypothetical protein